MNKTNLIFVLIFLLGTGLSYAERQNSLSSQLTTTASVDDNPLQGRAVANTERLDEVAPVYSMFPSLNFSSTGPASSFVLNYTFGYTYIDSSTTLFNDFQSHTVGSGLSAQLGRDVSLTFSERFIRSSDFAATNIFQGVVFTPEGVFFDFETVPVERPSYANSASLNVDYRVGRRSNLVFRFAHSLRNYDDDPDFPRSINDQNRFFVSVGWQTGGRTTRYGLNYDYNQHFFENFTDARSHTAALFFSHALGRSTNFQVNAGPSYVEPFGNIDQTISNLAGFLDYRANVRISQTIEENVFALFYSHHAGTSTGVGSISTTDRVGFNFSRPLGLKTRFNLGLSYFDTSRRLDNPIDFRGFQGSALLSFRLTDLWAVNVGANYQTQDLGEAVQEQFYDFERRRVFVSLVFFIPELARW